MGWRWGTPFPPPPPRCGRTHTYENITFPHSIGNAGFKKYVERMFLAPLYCNLTGLPWRMAVLFFQTGKTPLMCKKEKKKPGTSATLATPLPPPPPHSNENLELSSQVGLQITKCHFGTSDYKVPLYPPPPPPHPLPHPKGKKLADLILSSPAELQTSKCHFNHPCIPPPPPPRKCKVGILIPL